MKAPLSLIAAFCSIGLMPLHADQSIVTVQQALKDQGFYYGEINGTKDADTTAAIRRYQIRNGLKITGDLSPETEKSLGVRRGTAAAPTPSPARSQPRTTPPPATRAATPDLSDLREDAVGAPPRQPPDFVPGAGYAPGPHGLYPATGGVFDGTPYEVAPIEVQRQAVVGAQTRLAQQGLYRGAVDGDFGSGSISALRTFQARFGLQPSGRLDMETLAALGLLPGQGSPGINAPRRRLYRSPRVLPGPGERVYIPR